MEKNRERACVATGIPLLQGVDKWQILSISICRIQLVMSRSLLRMPNHRDLHNTPLKLN